MIHQSQLHNKVVVTVYDHDLPIHVYIMSDENMLTPNKWKVHKCHEYYSSLHQDVCQSDEKAQGSN